MPHLQYIKVRRLSLQHTVKEIPSYAKDTKDFIHKLNQIEEIPEDSLLVTLDVKSSYASNIKALKETNHKHPNGTVSTKVIKTFLSLNLTLNNLVPLTIYKKTGCAMGTVCFPSYVK